MTQIETPMPGRLRGLTARLAAAFDLRLETTVEAGHFAVGNAPG